MSLPGTVIEINENQVIVEVRPMPECNGCHACTGLLGGEKKSSLKQIAALKGNFNPQIGDRVILDTNPGEGSIAAILVFGFPMLSFFIGLIVAPYLADLLHFPPTDGTRLITALILMAISFVLLSFFSHTKTAKKLTLKITQIIPKQ